MRRCGCDDPSAPLGELLIDAIVVNARTNPTSGRPDSPTVGHT
jgi:hypothetical protein